MKNTIYLIDDHSNIRKEIISFLKPYSDWEIVGDADTGLMGFMQIKSLYPDIVLMDYVMPELDGVGAIQLIKETCPQTRFIMLSMHSDKLYIKTAFQAGVMAYVCKEDIVQCLPAAIHSVIAGKTYLSPAAQKKLEGVVDINSLKETTPFSHHFQ
jgi:DNA-binding NarL/FixJ family response regulator